MTSIHSSEFVRGSRLTHSPNYDVRSVLALQNKLLVSLTISKHMYLVDGQEVEALLIEFNGLAVRLLKLMRNKG